MLNSKNYKSTAIDALNKFFLFKQRIKTYFYMMQCKMYKDSLYIGKIISVVAKL